MVVGQPLIAPTAEICIQQLCRVEEMVLIMMRIRNILHALRSVSEAQTLVVRIIVATFHDAG